MVRTVSAQTDRRAELGAYAGIAFGIAVGVYGLFLKGEHWRGILSTLVIGLGLGGIMAGARALRSLPPDRIKPPHWLRAGVAIPAFVVGPALLYIFAPWPSRVALHDRELRGLTIAMPDGDETPNPQQTASLQVSDVGGFDVSTNVMWQIGTYDEPTVQALARGAAEQVHATLELVVDDPFVVGDGIQHRSFRIEAKPGTLGLTVFPCGSRLYGMFAGGFDASDLQRRILASVRCHAETDETMHGLPAIVDLPGWQLTESDAQHVTYTKDDETLVVAMMDIVPEAVLQLIAEGASKKLGATVPLGPRQAVSSADGTRAVWSGSLGPGGLFQIALWRCPERMMMLDVFHLGGADERTGMERIGHVRCARQHEVMSAPAATH